MDSQNIENVQHRRINITNFLFIIFSYFFIFFTLLYNKVIEHKRNDLNNNNNNANDNINDEHNLRFLEINNYSSINEIRANSSNNISHENISDIINTWDINTMKKHLLLSSLVNKKYLGKFDYIFFDKSFMSFEIKGQTNNFNESHNYSHIDYNLTNITNEIKEQIHFNTSNNYSNIDNNFKEFYLDFSLAQQNKTEKQEKLYIKINFILNNGINYFILTQVNISEIFFEEDKINNRFLVKNIKYNKFAEIIIS
jgi:hypothetical protein